MRSGSDRPLTEESIARAALDVLRDSGIAGLTMRAVAGRLGVQAPSLYHHVAGKDELLEAALRLVTRDELRPSIDAIRTVDTIEQWADVSRTAIMAIYDVFARYDGTALFMLARWHVLDRPLPHQLDEIDTLVRCGFAPQQAHEVYWEYSHFVLAAMAAFASGGHGRRDRAGFAAGIELVLAGVQAALRNG